MMLLHLFVHLSFGTDIMFRVLFRVRVCAFGSLLILRPLETIEASFSASALIMIIGVASILDDMVLTFGVPYFTLDHELPFLEL